MAIKETVKRNGAGIAALLMSAAGEAHQRLYGSSFQPQTLLDAKLHHEHFITVFGIAGAAYFVYNYARRKDSTSNESL